MRCEFRQIGKSLWTCDACGVKTRKLVKRDCYPKRLKFELCSHRGEHKDDVSCGICGSREVKVAVYACGLHERCVVQRIADTSIKYCGQCEDYVGSFDGRVVIISLHDSERRVEFDKAWSRSGLQYEYFDAVDGRNLKPPPSRRWECPPRSWACYRSHLAVIERFLSSGDTAVMVLEDDAVPTTRLFRELFANYYDALPYDWGLAYLGGQLLFTKSHRPEEVPDNEHWLRPYNVNRLHAYMLRRSAAESLYDWLVDPSNFKRKMQVDHCVGAWMKGRRDVYVPDQWLVTQRDGVSHIKLTRIVRNQWPDPKIFLR